MPMNHVSGWDANMGPVSARADLRRYPRSLYSVPISLHTVAAGVTRTFHGISVDISQGGLGALVSGGPRVGETVQIELPLGQQVLCAGAIVRHKTGPRSGFEFLGLTGDEKTQIAATIG